MFNQTSLVLTEIAARKVFGCSAQIYISFQTVSVVYKGFCLSIKPLKEITVDITIAKNETKKVDLQTAKAIIDLTH